MTFNNLCSSCTNIGCEFQSGIVRTECAFYMPPHMVEVGDDINVEGVVKFVEEDCKAILIETKAGTPIWISPKDIKTHRSNKKDL